MSPLLRVQERGCGYLPDPEGHQVSSVQHYYDRIGVPSSTADNVDFRAFEEIEDQSIAEACVSFAYEGEIASQFRRLGNALEDLSGYSAWFWARYIDSPGQPLLNVGCSPNQADRAIAIWGIATRKAWPCDPATMNDTPTLEKRVSALGFKFRGSYDGQGATRAETVDNIRRAHGARKGCVFALYAGPAYKSVGGGILMPEDGPPNHMVRTCGHRTDPKTGRTIIRLVGTWGTMGWGVGGFGEADESCVDQWESLRVLDVERVQ